MAADDLVGLEDTHEDELEYDNKPVHVFPLFGRPHVMNVRCWCEPKQSPDPTVPPGMLWLHSPDN